MNNLPKENFDPGWPPFLTDDDDDRQFVRVRDGSHVSDEPPIGNSVLYALVRSGTRLVENDHQYIPTYPWTETLRMTACPWDSDETLEAHGVPGLDPLPLGYEYEPSPPGNAA